MRTLSRRSRHRAREAALQMLYQWEIGGEAPDEVAASYPLVRTAPLEEAAEAMARALFVGTATHLAEIDPLIEAHARNWRLERMSVVDRLVLRLAVFELLHAPDTPTPVVIDEALELARTFSTGDAVKFVNGVLDAVWRQLAPAVPSGDQPAH